MKYILTGAVALIIILAGCQKKDDTTPDATKVSITFSKPTEGQTFKRGDTLFFDAAVGYLSELHGYDLSLINNSDHSILFEDQQHVHTDKVSISRYWVNNLSQATDLTLKLTVKIDHDGGEATKVIGLKSIL
jgi:hypothetical protein